MYKFIFEDTEKEQNSIFDPYHTKRIEFQVRDNSSLDEMLDAFENFLKANGYHFDGHVDIVNEDTSDDTVRFDEYGNYGENNPPVGDSPVFEKGYPSYDAVNRDYRDVKITYSGEPVYTGPYQK